MYWGLFERVDGQVLAGEVAGRRQAVDLVRGGDLSVVEPRAFEEGD